LKTRTFGILTFLETLPESNMAVGNLPFVD
jgi:hypothetical protein